MSSELKMYDLPPSPNNMKVHIALNYKELPCERIPVDFQDRSAVVAVSGQPLTPVLVHGDRVITDSGAILRYLDANFRQTRRLYSADRDAMKAIEDWELHARTQLTPPVGMLVAQAFSETRDPEVPAKATALLRAATARVEEQLAKGPWLVGNDMTAADVTCAPWVFYGMLPEQVASLSEIHRYFATSLDLGPGRDRTRAWVGRVMAYNS